jgi:endonuclease YncB( thermonuclease family)
VFGRRALLSIAALTVAASSAFAACDVELQGEGRVAAVVDARTLRLDDGREVRLSALEIPAEAGDKAASFLSNLSAGQNVTLHGKDDAPDRYGRQPAFVWIYGHDGSLQTALLAAGMALTGAEADRTCRAELMAAEAGAREGHRGLWADPGFVKKASEPEKILNNIGQFTVVEGTVLSARQAGATFYLNFSQRWNQGFAVTISRRMMSAFVAAGMPPATLANKRIRVRGWIEKRGGPRLEVLSPDQIELIGSNAALAAGGN